MEQDHDKRAGPPVQAMRNESPETPAGEVYERLGKVMKSPDVQIAIDRWAYDAALVDPASPEARELQGWAAMEREAQQYAASLPEIPAEVCQSLLQLLRDRVLDNGRWSIALGWEAQIAVRSSADEKYLAQLIGVDKSPNDLANARLTVTNDSANYRFPVGFTDRLALRGSIHGDLVLAVEGCDPLELFLGNLREDQEYRWEV